MPDDIRQRWDLTYRAAARIVAAGIAYAAENNTVPMSIAVVDAGAHLLAFGRHEDGIVSCIDLAIEKAVTAVTVGVPTATLWETLSAEPVLVAGLTSHRGILAVGGGLPIRHEGIVVGGVGVSGGHHSEDLLVAQAALAAIES